MTIEEAEKRIRAVEGWEKARIVCSKVRFPHTKIARWYSGFAERIPSMDTVNAHFRTKTKVLRSLVAAVEAQPASPRLRRPRAGGK